MAYLSFTFGIACIVYFVAIYRYAGLASFFHLFWAALAVFFLLFGFLLIYMKKKDYHFPTVVKLPVGILFFAGICIFLILELHIIQGAKHSPAAGKDYVIVLGCQVKKSTPSKMLKKRLDAAITYLEDNEDCLVIVSGGRGRGEDITEALAMQRYLIDKGIAGERIFMEEESSSTEENIRFSIEMMKKKGVDLTKEEVLVASNSFHVSRGVGIAKKQGIENAEALAGKTDALMVPTYYVREALALAKDLLLGNAEW